MARLAYVDGQYLPHRAASVHTEDRGYQFVASLLPEGGGGVLGNPHPPSVERRHGGDGEAVVVVEGDQRTRPAQPAGELSASFRRPMGGGAANLSRCLPHDPSRPAQPAAGPRSIAPCAQRRRYFPRG